MMTAHSRRLPRLGLLSARQHGGGGQATRARRELKPEDPTINDHLGDAYWRVGRVLEARFQWSHARDLKPEPEDLVKIEAKLKSGLLDDTAPPAAEHKKPDGG